MFKIKKGVGDHVAENNKGVRGIQIGDQIPLETLEKLQSMGKNAKELPKDHDWYEELQGDLEPYKEDLDALIHKRRKEG